MGDLTRLKVVNPPTTDVTDLVQRLRDIADRIEKREFGAVNKFCLVLDSPEEGVINFARGPEAFTAASVIGMLEVAKFQVIDDL